MNINAPTSRIVPARWLLASIVFLLGTPDGAVAQGNSDGSIYSRFGIGELQSYGSPQIVALGGGGTALGGNRYGNFTNPAAHASRFLTGVAAGLSYETVAAADALDNSGRLSNGSLRAVQFGFPLIAAKLGVGASFTPYSTRRYRIRLEDELAPPSADPVPYTVDFLGNGGIQQASLGVGFAATPTLSVGVEGQLLFGLLEEQRETTFADSDYESSLLTNSLRLRGFTGRIGILVSLPELRSDADLLTFGAQFTLPSSLDARQNFTSGPTQERDTLLVGVDGAIDLPWSASLGAAYRSSPRWLIVADVRYEPWTDFSSTVGLPGYDPADPRGLSDRTRVSGGFEFIPAGNDLLEPYFRRVGYRFGLFFDPLYLSADEEKSVNTIAVTGGLSLPTRLPGTRIDLNIEAGMRGAQEVGLVRERFIRFGLNLNVGERWFLKTRLG